jgi:16S rRNA (cytosine1402-N4)-methyltransferase
MERWHRSILVNEIIEVLRISPSGCYADLTFGEGGHSGSFLARGAGRVVGLDRDGEALERYRAEGEYRDDPRLELKHGRFSRFSELVQESFDGILIDLGPSTRQLLDPERGFSFSRPGPLDMRMDRREATSLFDVIQRLTIRELAERLESYADLKSAKKIADRIKRGFDDDTLKTTSDLMVLVGSRHGKTNPATQLFMALRMLINDELGEIEHGVPPLISLLKPGGRLAIITFHSGEDRLVKRILKSLAGRCICDFPICVCPREASVTWVLKKALPPGREEVRLNPRARSAKLRCVERIDATDPRD